MRVAVIGSRGITNIDLGKYLPPDTSVIVSGGARGVDSLAREYAMAHGIELIEFLPDYKRYKKGAPLKRNIKIIENSDLVLAFWDGSSSGTEYVIKKCRETGVPVKIIMPADQEQSLYLQ